MAKTIESNILDEAYRLSRKAARADVPLRLFGGVAIRLHVGDGSPFLAARRYQDIDLVCAKDRKWDVSALLARLGYEPNERFNRTKDDRMVFYDRVHSRHVDVFVGGFSMCHRLPLADRFDVHPDTLPLAELLLTKLQIIQVNVKDLQDACALLDVAPVTYDDVGVNGHYIAELCARSWGLHRTASAFLERIREHASVSDTRSRRDRIVERVEKLEDCIASSPKSIAWKCRSRIGERVRWYQEPEEIAHDK